MTSDNSPADTDKKEKASQPKSNRILLVPYPKFIFMYPTLLVSIIAAVVLYWGGYQTIDPSTQNLPVVITAVFLAVTMANMLVIIFDFPRATSLTMVFVITTIVMGLWIFTLFRPGILPSFASIGAVVRPAANATFFACIATVMLLMYGLVFICVRFDYWEVRNNELLHHHGFLSDLKRYPAPNLRVDKEINDVFEYLLLGAGRLILHPSTEKRAIVLDNVLFVGKKEQELTRVLGSIKVQIGSPPSDTN
ncbi:hypothetical protein [Roseimaritima ulvae]|uniref:Uncharacterized protein n=1 Tax=Roseimaritima ulvae TaxID=980254 RepID=A0A5B9QXV4_9BACT|nr:hypothetical protein [Roseimaritima ulvae]QEG43838.1 hypothetical protein UC8_58950 [Roseimaritima ulvae]